MGNYEDCLLDIIQDDNNKWNDFWNNTKSNQMLQIENNNHYNVEKWSNGMKGRKTMTAEKIT